MCVQVHITDKFCLYAVESQPQWSGSQKATCVAQYKCLLASQTPVHSGSRFTGREGTTRPFREGLILDRSVIAGDLH